MKLVMLHLQQFVSNSMGVNDMGKFFSLFFVILMVFLPNITKPQTLSLGTPNCTVASVIAQSCGNRTVGYRIAIIDGLTGLDCGNPGDTGGGSYENICRFTGITDTWIFDEGSPTASPLTTDKCLYYDGSLITSDSKGCDKDDVTDDDVETMTTSGADGYAPLGDSGGLTMVDIATQAEVDALFAASVPQGGNNTNVTTWYTDHTRGMYDSLASPPYSSAMGVMCIKASTHTEFTDSDPYDEWTIPTSSIGGAIDCNGGGVDAPFGICYTPIGWDTYDTSYHTSKRPFLVGSVLQIMFYDTTYVLALDNARYSVAQMKGICVCPGGTCEQDEACSLSLATTGGPSVITHEEVSFTIGGSAAPLYNSQFLSSAFYHEWQVSPGDCIYMMVGKDYIGWTQAAVFADRASVTHARFSVVDPRGRPDTPHLCTWSGDAGVGGKCVNNAVNLATGSGTQTLTLEDVPAAPTPWCATFINKGGHTVVLTPHASDQIEGKSVGASIQNDTLDDKIQLCNFEVGFWNIVGAKGVWQ